MIEMRKLIDLVESARPSGPLFFIRNTADPERDLHRGFSCHVDGWRKTEADAQEWWRDNGLDDQPPRRDPATGLWCADPEWGISSFAFWDADSYAAARKRFDTYWVEDGAAIFVSDDYRLGIGTDGEDCFRGGEFVGMIDHKDAWNDVLALTRGEG